MKKHRTVIITQIDAEPDKRQYLFMSENFSHATPTDSAQGQLAEILQIQPGFLPVMLCPFHTEMLIYWICHVYTTLDHINKRLLLFKKKKKLPLEIMNKYQEVSPMTPCPLCFFFFFSNKILSIILYLKPSDLHFNCSIFWEANFINNFHESNHTCKSIKKKCRKKFFIKTTLWFTLMHTDPSHNLSISYSTDVTDMTQSHK